MIEGTTDTIEDVHSRLKENWETVPSFAIQGDWNAVFHAHCGRVWVACKMKGEPSVYSKLEKTTSVTENGEECDVKCDGDFTVKSWSSCTINIMYNDYMCIFVAPRFVYKIHEKSVISFNANVKNPMCVSASIDRPATVAVWSHQTKKIGHLLDGHVGDIYKCRWFPSGRVVLSFGADMMVKIFCAETGRCGATLKGHTRAVTDAAIVDQGYNIITTSKDGTVKLWNCGKQRCIRNIASVSAPINCCAISTASSSLSSSLNEASLASDVEKGTEDKILMIGCENGTLFCYKVRNSDLLFHLELESAVNCMCTVLPGVFGVGCQNGSIHAVDISSNIVTSWHETDSAVTCIAQYGHIGFFTGHADGTCVFRPLDKRNTIRMYLTGPDVDTITDICTDLMYVYTSCRDSLIRRYFVHTGVKEEISRTYYFKNAE